MSVPGNRPPPGRAGLRALAELIAEALAGEPRLAVAGGYAASSHDSAKNYDSSNGYDSANRMSSERTLSESVRSTLHRPARTPGTGAAGTSTSNDPAAVKIPTESDQPPPVVAEDAIEAAHVEAEHVEAAHVEAEHVEAAHVEAEHVETWALVQAVQNGDGQAFGELYDRYVNQVFRFIYYRVNDRALAEDFTSETFLRALRRISTINYQGRDIGAWFMTIARNIVFDHTKSARFRLELTTGETVESGATEDSPETAVLAHLTNTRLLSAVNELGDEQKECIVLRFLQGLSVAETAAVMGKNDGAIKALQHRAVKRLANLLGDELR